MDWLLSEMRGEAIHIPVRLDQAASPTETPPSEFKALPAEEMESARIYLERRGLDPFTIRRFGILFCSDEEHRFKHRICFPSLEFWSGRFLGHVARSYIEGSRPKYLTDVPREVLAGYPTRDPTIPIAIVEGHFDGIAVARAGYQAAILGGIGNRGLEEFAARSLQSRAPLLVLLDGSARSEARTLYHRIRPIREEVFLLQLPEGIDPGEIQPRALRRFLDRGPGLVRSTSSA